MHELNRILKKTRRLIASDTKLSYCNNKYVKFKTTDQVSDQLYLKRIKRKISLGKVMLSAAASLVLSSKPNSSQHSQRLWTIWAASFIKCDSHWMVWMFLRWSVIISLFMLNTATVTGLTTGTGPRRGWKRKGDKGMEKQKIWGILSLTCIGCWVLQVCISDFFYKWTRIVLYLETPGLAFTGNVPTFISPVQLLSKPDQWQDC